MQLRGVPGAVQKFLGPVPSIEKKVNLWQPYLPDVLIHTRSPSISEAETAGTRL